MRGTASSMSPSSSTDTGDNSRCAGRQVLGIERIEIESIASAISARYLGDRLATERAKPSPHPMPPACIAFTTSNATGKLVIVAARCDMGCSFCVLGSHSWSTPSLH